MRSILATTLFIATTYAFCGHRTSLDPHINAITVDESTELDWGYDGLSNGPVNWFSSLRPWNSDCSFLSQQSPLNFPDFVHKTNSRIVMNIPTQALQVQHLNLTVEVFAKGHVPFGTLDFGEGLFHLKQFHFHTPSEHRVHSEYSPVEAHFVHESTISKGKLAVVAILFELRAETEHEPWESLLLAKNLNDKIPFVGNETTTPLLNFASVIEHMAETDVYQYDGSLTTPPCSSGVTFILSARKVELSWLHYNNLKALIKFNSRPVQNIPVFQNAILEAAKDISNCSSNTATEHEIQDALQSGMKDGGNEADEQTAMLHDLL